MSRAKALSREVLGHQVAGLDVALQQFKDLPRRGLGQLLAARVHGGDGAVARQGQADGLQQAVHGVGREHAGAGAAGGTGAGFDGLQLGLGHLAALDLAHALEDGDEVAAAAVGLGARQHGPAGDEDRRHVHAQGAHDHARRDLVAVGDADEGVEAVGHGHGLDAVGDQLPAGQRVAHAQVAHGDAIVHGDGVELEGHAPRLAHGLLDHRREDVQVGVARHDVGVRIHDADERFGKVLILHARRPQQAAVPGTLDALLHGVRSHGHSSP